MNTRRPHALALLSLGTFAACASSGEDAGAAAEEGRAAAESGWTTLFGGSSEDLAANFKGFREEGVPPGWQATGGELALVRPGGVDLVTRESFEDFELELEWKISPRGNSGIMFHVSEDPRYAATYFTGPEMQILDNAVFDGKIDLMHSAGADYAMHPAPGDSTRPVGEWNAARIVVRNGDVEYHLNGVEQCRFELGSPDWQRRVAACKFKDMPGYGVQGRGKIALQDHGNPVWFRNVRIRRLTR